ncbi:MAG: phosphoribosylaminoimidazolesuccinocarboxamide synthase [Candidatus Pacebacteria bacterium]|nr:phosphoribosylaminoimidazolesuccinocarboxamide synthase [Candidatus Paceibacterota bacterium]
MYEKGSLKTEGKTKRVYAVKGCPDVVIIENKDDITKYDDPALTRKMRSKARIATDTACTVFEILQKAGIPVAYRGRVSDTEFVADKCQMIPLEIVVRRYAVGSFLLRFVCFARPDYEKEPYRFENLRSEAFLKTTGGWIVNAAGKEIGVLPIDPQTKRRIEDPFIVHHPEIGCWLLKHPKLPVDSADSNILTISSEDILPEGASLQEMQRIAEQAFLILEAGFNRVDGLRLIDFKIEFGIGIKGQLFIADVIDNDSWRLRTKDWQELSKELFRQNKDMGIILEAYEYVAYAAKRAAKALRE